MLPELFTADSMVLRKPVGLMPTEVEATQFLSAGVPVDPWTLWAAGRPKSIAIGEIGRYRVRATYVRISFDVTVQADDLVNVEIDDMEYPIAIVQLIPGSVIAHVGVAQMTGADLKPSLDREMTGVIVFEVGRIRRLRDQVVS